MPEPTLISIPTLETPRLVLRTHRAGDFEAYARMWRDPSVYRFIGGQPRTREESWIRFLRHAGMWQMVGFGFWAIEERASGCFIGEAGLHDLKRDTTPSIEGLPEAGWSLLPMPSWRPPKTTAARKTMRCSTPDATAASVRLVFVASSNPCSRPGSAMVPPPRWCARIE